MNRIITSRIALFAAMLAGAAVIAANPPATAPAPDPRLSRETPEGTLRVFTFALMIGNRQLLDATMVPVSPEDMSYLLRKPDGPPLSHKAFDELKERCAKLNMRALKRGDKFKLPGGEVVDTTADDVNDVAMVLVLDNAPLPTRLYKAKGYWWVDAGVIIASRRAAEEFMKKHPQADTRPSDHKDK